jgi:hypothetical protein
MLGGRDMIYRTGLLGILFGAILALAGCNATDATLGVTAADAGLQAAEPGVPPSSQADAEKAEARLYIAPIIGSTVGAVTPLSRRLAALAPANGLAIVADTDPAKTYVVKGYFSALPENGATVIVFVWDVFNPSGVRQHRIQGQETVPGTAADPWSIVPPALMETIADRTIAGFKSWETGLAVAAGQVAPAAAPPIAPAVVAPVAAAPAAAAPVVASAVTPDGITPLKPGLIPTVPAPPPSINTKP